MELTMQWSSALVVTCPLSPYPPEDSEVHGNDAPYPAQIRHLGALLRGQNTKPQGVKARRRRGQNTMIPGVRMRAG